MVESLEENIPKRVIAPIFPLEQDDEQLELETQEAGSWLFREDIIQTVGVAVGFCVFLLVLGGLFTSSVETKEDAPCWSHFTTHKPSQWTLALAEADTGSWEVTDTSLSLYQMTRPARQQPHNPHQILPLLPHPCR